MALKRTGPGEVGFYPDVGTDAHALLYNFDIDGHGLKLEHKAYLDRTVVPRLQQGGSTFIRGMCSRSGSRAHNLVLSAKRAETVMSYLKRSSVPSNRIFFPIALGESVAENAGQRDGLEDQHHRAVELIVSSLPKPKPPPPRPKKPPQAPKKKWKKVRCWLDVDTLDILVVKKLWGSFVLEDGFCNPYAWTLSVSAAGKALSPKGVPPLMPGDFRTTAASFSYDPQVFDPKAQWKDKRVDVDLALSAVNVKIVNAFPRAVGSGYQPIIPHDVRIYGRDLLLPLKSSGGEAGGFVGVGSIKNARRVKGNYCA